MRAPIRLAGAAAISAGVLLGVSASAHTASMTVVTCGGPHSSHKHHSDHLRHEHHSRIGEFKWWFVHKGGQRDRSHHRGGGSSACSVLVPPNSPSTLSPVRPHSRHAWLS
jgi:hypothetical protein